MENSSCLNAVDLLLIVAETEWDGEELHNPSSSIYKILAEGPPDPIPLAIYSAGAAARFILRQTKLMTVAARVPIGLVDTALITRTLLETFHPSVVAQVGFGGILSDDLRLGDIAVASQVDCYLTKNKAATLRRGDEERVGTSIAFAGEVFRPSHSLVQLAINLKHAHPSIYREFQEEVRRSLKSLSLVRDPSHKARKYLRSIDLKAKGEDVSSVHAVHFACAEVISTTTEAVKWLRSRDRKLAIVDMESGGLLAAAWEYSHRQRQPIETLIIRGAGGYGDERHEEIIKKNSTEIHHLAFENACRFLCYLLTVRPESNSNVNKPSSVDIGILIPLEEEFSYFMDFLRSGISIQAEYREGRQYYLFQRGGLTCAATFVGDMGLVRMALATEDLYRTWTPSTLVVMGIAAGLKSPDGDVKICDVIVAKSVDLYFHRAHNRMGASDTQKRDQTLTLVELREDPPIPASEDLVNFATKDKRFAAARKRWRNSCSQELTAILKPYLNNKTFNRKEFGIATRPKIRGVRLASGEFLAAASEFVNALMARDCGAVDMEAGGAAIAYQRLFNDSAINPSPKLLILRGISDRGDEKKSAAEAAGEPNMFRRACMRNASRLLLLLLDDKHFADLSAHHRR